MAESTLSVTFADIRSAVGDYLGIGMDSAVWSATDTARVAGIIKSGLARFYFNPFYSDWSFLKPVTSLTTVAGQEDYELPDDFGHLLSSLTRTTPGAQSSISTVDEAVYRQIKSQNTVLSGHPRVACVVPIKMAASSTPTGQRFTLKLWPIPSSVFVLQYRYAVLPDVPTESLYPYGGAAHGETILQACLAVAEQRTNDGSSTNHQMLFDRLLAGSIERDRSQAAPHILGKNTDASLNRGVHVMPAIRARVNGVLQ